METVARVAVIYVFIMVGLRILGKREFGQLSPLELVSLLMVPEIVSQALTGDDYLIVNAVVGVATLLILVFASSVLTQRFKGIESVVQGAPTEVVRRGQFVEKAMNQRRIPPDEVFSDMRKSGRERVVPHCADDVACDPLRAAAPENAVDGPKRNAATRRRCPMHDVPPDVETADASSHRVGPEGRTAKLRLGRRRCASSGVQCPHAGAPIAFG